MAQTVTAADFDAEVLNSSDTVLVDFFAPWCGPCQALVPIVDELSAELGAGKKIVKVDVDAAPELASTYGVMSIPALKVFKNGEVVDEAVGMQSKESLMALLDR